MSSRSRLDLAQTVALSVVASLVFVVALDTRATASNDQPSASSSVVGVGEEAASGSPMQVAATVKAVVVKYWQAAARSQPELRTAGT